MFGGFRLLLAIFVALSHFGFTFAGFNPGQWSVICFYTLSGILMDRQFKKFSISKNSSWLFYLDRFMRVYPLYFVVLMLTCWNNHITWKVLVPNLLLLPLHYNGVLITVPPLVNPAWSLACEVHFYFFVPFLVLTTTKTLRLLLISSLLLFIASPFLPFSNFWGYLGFPGVFFTFATGMLINRRDFVFVKAAGVALTVALIIFGLEKYFLGVRSGININVCFGYLMAIASITLLDQYSPRWTADKILGYFSYPLFLCHGLVASVLESVYFISSPVLLLLTSLLFAAILVLTVEIPFDWIRYRVRVKHAKAVTV